MQDRYVGDIGDFGKYTLIRSILSWLEEHSRAIRLGVNWYRTQPEKNGDGQFLDYLDGDRELEKLDPELFAYLRHFRLGTKPRALSEIENPARAVLPPNTAFFSEVLDLAARDSWHETALSALADADLVFLDPDNGLEVQSVRRHHDRSVKYAYRMEIEAYLRRGQSVLLYQHQNRYRGGFNEFLRQMTDDLEARWPDLLVGHPNTIVFRRQGVRAFVLLPAGRQGKRVEEAFRQIKGRSCSVFLW